MAKKKTASITFNELRAEITQRNFRNIYILQGEEPYYIDRLSELIVENALTEDERDFNLNIFYGNDADVREVISTCKQYPAFAQRRVVVLREAQLVPKQQGGGHKDDLNLFALYAQNIAETTVLVICHKTATLKAKEFTDLIAGDPRAAVFTSNKVRNNDLKSVISSYVTTAGCTTNEKCCTLMAEYVGNDLSRLFGELDKLIMLAGDSHAITDDMIEKNIGISKDYNNFELEDALIARNAPKAFKIIDYYQRNPKLNPAVVAVSSIFGFFANALIVKNNPDKSQAALIKATGNSSIYRIAKFISGANNYSLTGLINIIGYIRRCDARIKGIGSRQSDEFEHLRELVYNILATP